MENAPNFLQPSSLSDLQKSVSFFRKRYERFYHHALPDRMMHLIGDSLLMILILFFGSYASISFVRQKFFSPVSASFRIIMPGDIVSAGVRASFLVRYENKTRVPLRNARMIFRLHPFFESATSSLFMLNPRTYVMELGTIEASQEKEFILSGIPFGARDDVQTLSGELSFQSNARQSREHISAFTRYGIQKGAIHLSCSGPAQVTFYQVFDHGCTLSNSLETNREDVSLTFSFPPSYTNRVRSSALKEGVLSLSGHEKKDIPLKGFFQKEGVGAQKISVQAYLLRDGKKYFQDETRVSMRVRAPALSLTVRHEPLRALLPGKAYPFTLHWKNESTESISDAVISIFVHGDFLDSKNISSKNATKNTAENILVWTRGQLSGLKTIQPSEEGDLSFTLTLDAPDKKQSPDKDHAFQIIFEPSASYADEKQETVKVFSLPQGFDISSDISLQAFARYYTTDGEQIGRGPLPPRVGKTTRYQIFFAPKQSIHAIENFTVTAELGPHVVWTGIAPVGSEALRYYPEKKILTYFLPVLPSLFSRSDEQSGAVFELVLTPTAEDKGLMPVLLQNIRVAGKDGATHMPLEFNASDMTTDLVFDSRAKSAGGAVR